MQTTKTLESRSSGDALAVTRDPQSKMVTLHHQHTDDFDGDGDSWVTIGEFAAVDIINALLPPTPATHHASLAPTPTRRRRWRRK